MRRSATSRKRGRDRRRRARRRICLARRPLRHERARRLGRKAVVLTPDGRAVEGTVVGRDVDRDIALLHAPEARVPR